MHPPPKPSLVERALALIAGRSKPRLPEFAPALAVFGKHPAFGPEHLESGLGPGVDACAPIKFRVYNRCIEPLIPRWAEEPPDNRLPGFDHFLLYLDPLGGAVLGRLISRADAVGREGFPSVLLVYLPVHSPEALAGASRALARFESRLGACTTPEEVVEAADRSQADLEGIAHPNHLSMVIPTPATRSLFRNAPSGHRRVEISNPDHPIHELLRHALNARAESKADAMVIMPRKESWADVLFGEFGPDEFHPVMLRQLTASTLAKHRARPSNPWANEPHGPASDQDPEHL